MRTARRTPLHSISSASDPEDLRWNSAAVRRESHLNLLQAYPLSAASAHRPCTESTVEQQVSANTRRSFARNASDSRAQARTTMTNQRHESQCTRREPTCKQVQTRCTRSQKMSRATHDVMYTTTIVGAATPSRPVDNGTSTKFPNDRQQRTRDVRWTSPLVDQKRSFCACHTYWCRLQNWCE